MGKRIGMRISDEDYEKFLILKEKLGKESITGVIKHCIEKEYERVVK